MDDTNHRTAEPPASRETFLAAILALFLGVGAAIFLMFVTGGFFFWVILVSAGLGLLVSFHYLVWGRLMESSVNEERARLAQEEHEEEGPAQPWERRF